MKRLLVLTGFALMLSGCETIATNPPTPTATESLLRSHAGEQAATGVNLRIKRGTKTFIIVEAGATLPGGEYAAAAFRAHLAGAGAALVDDIKLADTIVELRIGTASIDDTNRVFGLAAITIPGIPGTSITTAVAIPELPLYAKNTRMGIVELHAIARDAHTGMLTSAVGPLWGVSEIVNHRIALGIVTGDLQEPPGIISKRSH